LRLNKQLSDLLSFICHTPSTFITRLKAKHLALDTAIILLLLIGCSGHRSQQLDPVFTTYPIECSIRALEVLDENLVWFAGNKGVFGWTNNGGANWHIDSIVNRDQELEFRSIVVTSEAVMLLSVGSPAYLYRTTDRGLTWSIVYQEDHPDVFYDSMQFWDDQNGMAMGDPTGSCLSVILTKNGGKTWRKLDCTSLPETFEGEAAFAASNSNLSLYKRHAWMVSGGTKARVFHSPDTGKSWEVFQTPIVEGGKMTGIFSVDFYDENRGVIFGGDWEDKTINSSNKAITTDGGKNWHLISDGYGPGYRSCVQYVPGSNAQKILAVGPTGISYSGDAGVTWHEINQQDYYTVRVVNNGRTAWLAGNNKIAKMHW
jgi:photosystem II stability/assembly factor-like uncharacterized protein